MPCAAWQVARTVMKCRLAIKVSGPQDLQKKLQLWLAEPGVSTGREHSPGEDPRVFAMLEVALHEKDLDVLGQLWTLVSMLTGGISTPGTAQTAPGHAAPVYLRTLCAAAALDRRGASHDSGGADCSTAALQREAGVWTQRGKSGRPCTAYEPYDTGQCAHRHPATGRGGVGRTAGAAGGHNQPGGLRLRFRHLANLSRRLRTVSESKSPRSCFSAIPRSRSCVAICSRHAARSASIIARRLAQTM